MLQFRPSLSRQQTQQYIQMYYQDPMKFNPMQVNKLANHANYYGYEFKPIPQEKLDFNLFRALGEFGEGYLSGFTTLNIGDDSYNPIERVFKASGRAMGFIGFVPTFGLAPLKLVSTALRGKSIPLLASKALEKKVAPIVGKAVTGLANSQFKTAKTLANIVSKEIPKDIISGMFQVGTAGAVSNWQQGIDGMINGLIGGSVMEFGDRLIANTLRLGSAGQQQVMRTIAGALWNGLPSTMRKTSVPEQVYDYLTGGLFAYNDVPAYQRLANDYIVKMRKNNALDPQLLPDWDGLSEPVKREVKSLAEEVFGTRDVVTNFLQYSLKEVNKLNEAKLEQAQNEEKELTNFFNDYMSNPVPNTILKTKLEGYKFSDGLKENILKINTDMNKEAVGSYVINALQDIGETRATLTNSSYYYLRLKQDLENTYKTLVNEQNDLLAQKQSLIDNAKADEQVEITTDEVVNKVLSEAQGLPTAVKKPVKTQEEVTTTKLVEKIVNQAVGITKEQTDADLKEKFTEHASELIVKATGVTNDEAVVKASELFDYMTKKDYNSVVDYGNAVSKLPYDQKVKNAIGLVSASVYDNAGNLIVESPTKSKTIAITNPVWEGKVAGEYNTESINKILQVNKPTVVLTSDYYAEMDNPDYVNLNTVMLNNRYNDFGSGVWVKQDTLSDLATTRLVQRLVDERNDINLGSSDLDYRISSFRTGFYDLAKKMYLKQKIEESKLAGLVNTAVYKMQDLIINTEDTPAMIFNQLKMNNYDEADLRQLQNTINLLRNTEAIPTYVIDGSSNVKDKVIEINSENTKAGGKTVIKNMPKDHYVKKVARELGYGADYEQPITWIDGIVHDYRLYSFNDMSFAFEKNPPVIDFDSVLPQMSDKGFLPFSGSGDKKRLYFIKAHPNLLVKQADGNSTLKPQEQIDKDYFDLLAKERETAKLTIEEQNELIKLDKQAFIEYLKNSGKAYNIEQIANIYKLAKLNNTYWFKDLYGFDSLDDIVNKDYDFICDGKAINKRQQIFFTNGIPVAGSSKESNKQWEEIYIQAHKSNGISKTANDAFNLRYAVYDHVIDPTQGLSKTISFTANDDGNIWVTPEFMKSLNDYSGIEGFFNKSFIVSPSKEYGTLAGKFGFHIADKETLEYMRKHNLDMLAGKSAIKQLGKRKLSSLDSDEANVYTMKPNDIRTILGEKADGHYISAQKVPKQVRTVVTFTDFVNDINGKQVYRHEVEKVYKDMTDTLVKQSIEGKSDTNELYNKYVASGDIEVLKEVLADIDNLSIKNIQELANSSDINVVRELAETLILKNKDIDEADASDGFSDKESTNYEENQMRINASIQDEQLASRLLRNISSPNVVFSEDVSNFRDTILKKYITDRVARPISRNSAVARLRGINPLSMKNKRYSEMKDDEFFLTAGYKKLKINWFDGNETKTNTLEELFNMSNKTQYVNEALNALVLRVPMDSIEGAQKLKLKGFIDEVDGYEIVVHGFVKEMIGGADDDGDKAFIFFGGKSEDNQGEGFKQSWMDMYASRKYNRVNKQVSVVKPEPKQQLANIPKGKYVNHSGGADGSDTQWGIIGEEMLGVKNKHYFVTGNKTPKGNTEISISQAKEADEHLAKANKTLNRRFPTSNEYVNNLLRRSWQQVNNSEQIMAIGNILENVNFNSPQKQIVDGGTGWAVQMAIDNNKETNVFNLKDNSWYTYDYTKQQFVKTDTPTLKENFAGIGTRRINEQGIQAIKDVYAKTKSMLTSTQQAESTALTTKEWITKTKKFEGMDIKFVDNIPTQKANAEILARRTGNEIMLNLSLLTKKFNDKAWTKPHTQMDGSKAEPINEYEFKTEDELLRFVLLHEKAHTYLSKNDSETTGEFETRINNEALKRLDQWRLENETHKTVVENFVKANNISAERVNIESFKDAETEEQTAVRVKALLENKNAILSNSEIRILNKMMGIPEKDYDSFKTAPKIATASELTDPVFFSKQVVKLAESGEYDALYIITKHDGLPMLDILQTKIPKIIHFSITTLGGTKYEPGVMKYNDLLDKIESYIKQGLDPETITIRIDPIIPGLTKIEDVEAVIKRVGELGIPRIKSSVMDAYSSGYTDIVKDMLSLGYDFDAYKDKNGKIQFHAKKEIIDYWGAKLLELADTYGVKEVASCADKFSDNRITRLGCCDVTHVNKMLGSHYERDTFPKNAKQRALCSCFGGKTDLLSTKDKCASSCVYCYARHGSNTSAIYYNEDGTLKDNAYTQTVRKVEATQQPTQQLEPQVTQQPELYNYKREFADELTIEDDTVKKLMKSKGLFYSPGRILKSSYGASVGRDQLGLSVNNSARIVAMYNTLVSKDGFKPQSYADIMFTPKKDISKGLRIIGAEIGYGSDPMDVAGLKQSSDFLTLLFDGFFDLTDANGKPIGEKQKASVIQKIMQNSLAGKFSKINKLVYSKDLKTQKQYTLEQAREMLIQAKEGIDGYPDVSLYSNLANNYPEIDTRLALPKEKLEAMYSYFRRDGILQSNKVIQDILYSKSALISLNKTNTTDQALLANDVYMASVNLRIIELLRDTSNTKEYSAKLTTFVDNKPVELTNSMAIRDRIDKLKADAIKFKALNRQASLGSYSNISHGVAKQIDLYKQGLTSQERDIFDTYLVSYYTRSTIQLGNGKDMVDLNKEKITRDQLRRYNNNIESLFNDIVIGGLTKTSKDTFILQNNIVDDKLVNKIYENFDKVLNMDSYDINKGNAIPEPIVETTDTIVKETIIEPQKTIVEETVTETKDKVYKLYRKTAEKVYSESKPDAIESVQSVNKDAVDVLSQALPETESDYKLGNTYEQIVSRLKEIDVSIAQLKNKIDDATFKAEEYDYAQLVKDGDFELPIKHTALFNKLLDHIDHYNIPAGYLKLIARSVVHKDLSMFTIEDWKVLDNYFNDIRTPSFWQKLRGVKADKDSMLSRWHYFLFPQNIDKDLMTTSLSYIPETTAYLGSDGKMKEGYGLMPSSTMGIMQDVLSQIDQRKIKAIETDTNAFLKEIFPVVNANEHGNELFELAVWDMESTYFMNSESPATQASYIKQHAIIKEKYKDIINKEYDVHTEAGLVKMTGEEILKDIQSKIALFNEKLSMIQRGATEAIPVMKNGVQLRNDDGSLMYDYVNKTLEKYEVKPVFITVAGKTYEIKQYDVNAIIESLQKSIYKQENFDISIGIDGVNELSKSIFSKELYELYRKTGKKEYLDMLANFIKIKVPHTGQINFNEYFPHVNMKPDKERNKMLVEKLINKVKAGNIELARISEQYKLSEKYSLKDIFIVKNKLKNIADDSTLDRLSELEKDYVSVKKEAMNISMKSNGQNMDLPTIDELLQDDIYDAIKQSLIKGTNLKEANDALNFYSISTRTANQQSRVTDDFLGYERTVDSYIGYMKSQINMFHRRIANVVGKHYIHKFQINNIMKDSVFTDSWAKFFKMYLNDSLSYPTILSPALKLDKAMKLDYNPYYALADNRVRDFLFNAGTKLGIIKMPENIPAEISDTITEMLKPSYGTVIRISQLEAQYQLASLLAHPKSMFTNLYGGSIQSIASAGLSNFIKAQDMKYLKQHINPQWNDRADVTRWVRQLGVIEEYLLNELGNISQTYGKGFAEFARVALGKISKNPEFSDVELKDLAKKHNISDAILDKAGWFMRVSERKLRTDAFLAHYIQAKNRFNNLFPEYDANGEFRGNPYLIKLAMKGVESTQYMYSASYRPAFARTAFGKILTRFQLYTLNTLHLRQDLYNKAKVYGYNSAEFDRFARFAVADMVSVALSSAFVYTLFDYALPSPYNYIQDLANFMFGDEDEKKRAFFGSYPYPLSPLQVVTPPALRMFPALVTSLATNEWKNVTEYQAWVMFPFGRLARDINRTYKNPDKGIDYLTGIPISRLKNQAYEDEKKGVTNNNINYTISGIL